MSQVGEMRDKIKSLQRTIQYLNNTDYAIAEIEDSKPGYAKLILKEMFNQTQYQYK